MKYLLSICIPNYNRINCLQRLLQESIKQISENQLEKTIQICINDDASTDNPTSMIETIIKRNPKVKIVYKRNDINRGMDYNFMQSVLISESEFCWIIGNDDIIEAGAILKVMDLLQEAIKKNISLIVTSFKVYTSKGEYRYEVNPLMGKSQIYNLKNVEQRKNFINRIAHESAIFAFLSNVIFRRNDWICHKDMFLNKMNSIFIQMYMNIQTLIEGKNYLYANVIIIKNYLDESPDGGYLQRMYKISIGLYNVLEYFFDGNELKILQEKIVTPFIINEFWDNIGAYKEILDLKIKKVEIYKKYYKNKVQLKNKNYENIIIFGAGEKGQQDAGYLKTFNISIVMFIDNFVFLNKCMISGILVKNVTEGIEYLKNKDYKIVVSNYNLNDLEEMIEQLCELGVKEEDIIII